MLFGQRPGLQAPERHEQGGAGEDIAIFPLAIPLLSGPGTITTVLLVTNQIRGDILRLGIFAAVIAAVYLIAWWVLYAGERVMARSTQARCTSSHESSGLFLPPSPFNIF